MHCEFKFEQLFIIETIFLFFFFFENLPCELGSGKLSRGTKCITVVLPNGSPSAPKVTLQ